MKILTTALMVGLLSVTSLAFANHEPNDPYEAMCQSTGGFRAVNYNRSTAAEREGCYYQLQLFGRCGDEPNLLEIDRVKIIGLADSQDAKLPYEQHLVEFWQSPKISEGSPYWKLVAAKEYMANKYGDILSSKKVSVKDQEKYLTVASQSIMDMVITEYVAAKKGGPLFPSAMPPIQCDKNQIDEAPVLEQAHFDFVNKK